jgi:hypothetical protein
MAERLLRIASCQSLIEERPFTNAHIRGWGVLYAKKKPTG